MFIDHEVATIIVFLDGIINYIHLFNFFNRRNLPIVRDVSKTTGNFWDFNDEIPTLHCHFYRF